MKEEIQELNTQEETDKVFYIQVNYHGGNIPYAFLSEGTTGKYDRIYKVKIPLLLPDLTH